jgi:hypothetical protein
MRELDIFSSDTLLEATPFLEVEVVSSRDSGTPIGVLPQTLRDRIVSFKMIFERKKRPKVSISFFFEDYQTADPLEYANFTNTFADSAIRIDPASMKVGSDILNNFMPLDSRVKFKAGYISSFRQFGPFDVVEHDVRYRKGGSEVNIELQMFGRSRGTSVQEVFSSGSLYDAVVQLCNRDGIELAFTNVDLRKHLEEGIKPDDYYFGDDADSQASAKADNAYNLDKILTLSPDSPLVIQPTATLIGELHRIFLNLGLSIGTDSRGRLDVTNIFNTAKKPLVRLVYGKDLNLNGTIYRPNVSDINFEVSKPKMTYLRKLVEQAVSKSVGKKGRVNGRKIGTQIPAAQASSEDGEGSNTPGGSTSTPSTKYEIDRRKYLGTVVGRRRAKGEILSATVKLMTGTPLVTTLMPVEIKLDSTYYSGKYIIDKVTHVFNTRGFNTSLKIIRPPKKSGKKKSKGGVKSTVNGRNLGTQIPVSQPSSTVSTPTPQGGTASTSGNQVALPPQPKAKSKQPLTRRERDAARRAKMQEAYEKKKKEAQAK